MAAHGLTICRQWLGEIAPEKQGEKYKHALDFARGFDFPCLELEQWAELNTVTAPGTTEAAIVSAVGHVFCELLKTWEELARPETAEAWKEAARERA